MASLLTFTRFCHPMIQSCSQTRSIHSGNQAHWFLKSRRESRPARIFWQILRVAETGWQAVSPFAHDDRAQARRASPSRTSQADRQPFALRDRPDSQDFNPASLSSNCSLRPESPRPSVTSRRPALAARLAMRPVHLGWWLRILLPQRQQRLQ